VSRAHGPTPTPTSSHNEVNVSTAYNEFEAIVGEELEEICREFLMGLWGSYTSYKPLWFEIFAINDEGEKLIKFFEGPNAPIEACEWLINKYGHLASKKYHVYFGVLPRFRKPERGRGSASDVDRGMWLWVDLDFKKTYENLNDVPISEETKEEARKVGYWFKELDDYALRGIYRSNDKWVYVDRPPLSDVIERVKNKLGNEPTIVVDSGGGYHLYFKLRYEVEVWRLRKLEEKVVDVLGADRQSKDLARVLRLVGSVNPRLNRVVRIIKTTLTELDPEELERRLSETEVAGVRKSRLRVLGDNELLEIKELLKEAWVEGQRQYLALFLSGWFAKARIHPVTVAKLFRILAEERTDDELDERLSTIYYSYKKALGHIPELQDVDKLIEEWRVEGILRRNVSRAISKELEERVKGKSGVQEVLESSLGEERALEVVRRIEELLGCASPFKDSIFELLDYEKQLYAVANLRKLVIARVRRDGNKLVYKERVAPVAPTRVTVYVNPLGGLNYKYEVIFEGKTLLKPLKVGPAPIQDIVARLRAEGLVYNKRLIEDVINAVIQGYMRKGKAEIKEEIEAPGFYLIDNNIVVVRWKPREISKEELKETLELLNELANSWFNHSRERFATIIKWGVVAPFSYILKQKGKWLPWLYLYGASYTGKTTLGEIILAMWGLGPAHRKSGSSIDTVPRLGYVLSQSTFPILINEPGGAIYREDVIEVMKSAIESTIARGKYVKGSYTEIPSLAPLIMTSNKSLPKDDALLRRLLVIKFTYGERIAPNRASEFDDSVKPRLDKLSTIGYWISKQILENPQLFDLEPMELAKKLLTKAYEEVGIKAPDWVNLTYETEENIYDDIKETIKSYLIKRINDEYNKFVGKVMVESSEGIRYISRQELSFEERVRIVLESKLLPWVTLKDDYVIFTTDFAREIRNLVGDIGGLKSIAELLSWEYGVFRIGKKTLRGARVNLREFIDFLT
jgi:hypothetical protein